MMMDLTTATTTTTTTTTTPDTETETPPNKPTEHHEHAVATATTTAKILSFTNGAFKRHLVPPPPAPPVVVVYKECLKNHAASLGGHALDGCGEFMPSPTATVTDPTSLKCAACGCHRNFHRRDPEEGTHFIEYHHQQVLPQPQLHQRGRSPNSVSPPPISSSYYPASAPHMLLALSTGGVSVKPENQGMITPSSNGGGRKRFRTKFSHEQKEKMYSFSEKLGWKLQKRDENLVEEFCNEVGVGKGVLKVWMHNNKHTFGKKEGGGNSQNSDQNTTNTTTTPNNNIISTHHTTTTNNNNIIISNNNTISSNNNSHHQQNPSLGNNVHHHVVTNGSSSSS